MAGDPDVLVNKRYRVLGRIGGGGMGVVVRVYDESLHREAALKLIHLQHLIHHVWQLPDLSTDERDEKLVKLRERFYREARATAKLQGEHTVTAFDAGELAEGIELFGSVFPIGTPFLVTELLRGRDLRQELERTVGAVPARDAVDWIIQACAGLAPAHAAQMVHRDLKPENLFLVATASGSRVKVIDFGIVKTPKTLATTSLTGDRTWLGTTAYAAPEQLNDAATVDTRADLWSLGIVLYELLARRRPFDGETAAAVAGAILHLHPLPIGAGVPAALEQAVFRCLAKSPADRTSTLSALARDLAPFASTRWEPIARELAREEDEREAAQTAFTTAARGWRLDEAATLAARLVHLRAPGAEESVVAIAAARWRACWAMRNYAGARHVLESTGLIANAELHVLDGWSRLEGGDAAGCVDSLLRALELEGTDALNGPLPRGIDPDLIWSEVERRLGLAVEPVSGLQHLVAALQSAGDDARYREALDAAASGAAATATVFGDRARTHRGAAAAGLAEQDLAEARARGMSRGQVHACRAWARWDAEVDGAAEELGIAVELGFVSVPLLEDWAMILHGEGRIEEALRVLERISKVAPHWMQPYELGGRWLDEAGRQTDALTWLARAPLDSRASGIGGILEMIWAIHLKQKNWPGIFATWEASLKPPSTLVNWLRTRSKELAGELDKALFGTERTGRHKTMASRRRLEFEAFRSSEAKAFSTAKLYLEVALTTEEDDRRRAALHAAQARALEAMLQGEDACEAFALAVQEDPSDRELWPSFGAMLLRHGLFDRARTAYDRALELNPTSGILWLSRAEVRLKQGDREGAIDDILQAVDALVPRNELHTAGAQDLEQAELWLQRAEQTAVPSPALRTRVIEAVIQFRLATGKVDLAERNYTTLLELRGTHPNASKEELGSLGAWLAHRAALDHAVATTNRLARWAKRRGLPSHETRLTEAATEGPRPETGDPP